MVPVQFHTMPDGSRIAFRHAAGRGPLIVFLPGYMSDMEGSKATAVYARAVAAGRACLLLDYSGCGQSLGKDRGGDFADGTLTRWREEVLALIDHATSGPVVLVGSSMGGWLALLAGVALGRRLAGLVGIAAAPDFSDWGYSGEQRARLAAGESVFEGNPYGPEPTPTHARFWLDAQRHLLLEGEIAIDCPVRLVHGQRDREVPWEISLRLAERLRSDDVQVTLVKTGEHRLSRDGDIALILRQVWSLLEPEA
ncbi:MAG: alpha/beta hydrolase [Erythrobacter sp.]|nr:alpha/beta hydrolase [Erythrobacter sp.]